MFCVLSAICLFRAMNSKTNKAKYTDSIIFERDCLIFKKIERVLSLNGVKNDWKYIGIQLFHPPAMGK